MAKTSFTQAARFAIFTVHGEKCWLCEEPVSLSEAEIDHVIPESLEGKPELPGILKALGLTEDFDLNGWANLKPAHRRCNGQKSARVFKPSGLMQMHLEAGLERAPRVEETIHGFLSDRKLDKAVAIVLEAVENGRLGDERIERITKLVSEKAAPYREPELRETPFSIAPHLQLVRQDAERYWLRGPGGMVGYRPKNATHISWDCPNCGPTGWNGTRCISCGHFVDPD